MDLAKPKSRVLGLQVARQLLGKFLYFDQIVSFRATFCMLSNFEFPITSEKSEQLLVRKLALFPYFTMF